MLLLSDGRLDDCRMKGIWDQADDQIVLRNCGIKGFLVGDIEGDWMGILDAFGELLGTFESSASYPTISPIYDYSEWIVVPTETLMPSSLRISRVGRVTKPAPSISTFLLHS
jgi:hypothetical protein